jgi:hypothetical protein
MVATPIASAFAQTQFINYLSRAHPISWEVPITLAKADIKLPFYLDLRFGTPIMQITVVDTVTPAHITMNLLNAGGTSDQVLLTAVGGDQPGAGQFMIGKAAGTNPGNYVILGTAIAKISQMTVNAIWEGIED